MIQTHRILFLQSVMNQQTVIMDVELLIIKVRENCAIYDASDKNHSNRNFIAAVWMKISEDLNISADLLKEKWHQLRSNYMRVKRSEKSKSFGSGTKSKPRWPYFELMSFLDQYSEPRDTSGNVQQSSPYEADINEISSEKYVFLASANTENDTSSSKKKKNKRKREDSVVNDADSQYMSDGRKKNVSLIDENDPDRMFLLSLLPSMKQLNSNDSMDFKLYALQFLKDKLHPTATSHNVWLRSQSPQVYQTQQQYQEWSETTLNSPGSSSHCSSIQFKQGSPPPLHQMDHTNNN